MTEYPPERIELADAELTRLREADAAGVAAAVAASLDHLRPWMPWAGPGATDVVHQRERAVKAEQAWDDGSEFVYVLRAPDDDTVLGTFGLHRRIGPGAIEIGYWVHVDHTGRGHATAAAGALTGAGLGLSDVDRVEIHTDQANHASAAVPRKLGYTLDRVDDHAAEAPGETGRLQIWITTAPTGELR